MRDSKATIREHIASGTQPAGPGPYAGVALREFVSAACGASGFSTGTATFEPSAELPCHRHEFSEAVTVIAGEALISVEGRAYRLAALDCMHVPAGVAHSVRNPSPSGNLVALWAFASANPSRELVEDNFSPLDRTGADPDPADPEHIARYATAETYELSEGAVFRDLFAARFGSRGICGGYGVFRPGSSLPCHVHKYDESITIVSGEAVCKVAGRMYRLSGCDTAFVPEGQPHRFLNHSAGSMAMIWVYAGDEPERTIIDAAYCDGVLPWSSSL